MERCPNCGASIRTGARFCTACGFRLLQPSATVSPVVLEPTAIETPVAGSETSPDDAPTRGSERVTWHGDSRPTPDTEGRTDAGLSVRPDGSSGIEDTLTMASAEAADGIRTVQRDEPSIGQASGTWPSKSEPVLTETVSLDEPNAAATGADSSPSSDEGARSPLEAADEQQPATVGLDESPDPSVIDDERLDFVQPAQDPSDSVDAPDAMTEGDLSSEATSTESPDAIAGAHDQITEVGTAQPESAATSAEPEAVDRQLTEPVDDGETGPDGTANTAPFGDRPDEVASVVEVGMIGQQVPADGSRTWRDEVDIETPIMAETELPGYYDDHGERPSLTGEIERAADRNPADLSSAGAPASIGEDAAELTDLVSDSASTTGRDDDWEPWGTGGMDDPESAGDRPGEANGLPIDRTGGGASDQPHGGADTSGITQARVLLNQLREAIDSLEPSVTLPAPDPGAELAIESVAEIGQILDGLPSATIDAERLAELTRLAEDLTGRDYDIRALQRFAQERETILNLATEVQQQRDVIDQIRSVVTQPRP